MCIIQNIACIPKEKYSIYIIWRNRIHPPGVSLNWRILSIHCYQVVTICGWKVLTHFLYFRYSNIFQWNILLIFLYFLLSSYCCFYHSSVVWRGSCDCEKILPFGSKVKGIEHTLILKRACFPSFKVRRKMEEETSPGKFHE